MHLAALSTYRTQDRLRGCASHRTAQVAPTLEEDNFPTNVVVEDNFDADAPTALADVTAERASTDTAADSGTVPLVTDACPACVLCKEEPFGGNPEEIRLPAPAT